MVEQLKRTQSTLFSVTEEPTDAEFCTKLAKSRETALVEELSANVLVLVGLVTTAATAAAAAMLEEDAFAIASARGTVPGGYKAGSKGVQPLVNNLFYPSGAIKRGHKGCNPLSTMRS